MMILTIDVGNSNIVLGPFDGEKLLFVARIATDTRRTPDETAVVLQMVLRNYGVTIDQIKGTIISSVVPYITSVLSEALEFLTGNKPYVIVPGIKTGINIKIDNPAQLGGDMLVDSVAAIALYPKPVIVIDMGTATTISVVNEKNEFLGAAIFPGVRIALEALSDRTAQLPHINIESPQKAIGTNSVDSMKSGVVLGNAGMLDGIIDNFEKELGKKCSIVATGGMSEVITKHTRHKVIYNRDLLLEGLYIIYKKNFEQCGR